MLTLASLVIGVATGTEALQMLVVSFMIFIIPYIAEWIIMRQDEADKVRKENIILTSEGDSTASVFTYNADLKRRLEKFSKTYPTLCKIESSNDEDGVTYVMDKARLSIRLVAPYSEERRKAASENAKKNGFSAFTNSNN